MHFYVIGSYFRIDSNTVLENVVHETTWEVSYKCRSQALTQACEIRISGHEVRKSAFKKFLGKSSSINVWETLFKLNGDTKGLNSWPGETRTALILLKSLLFSDFRKEPGSYFRSPLPCILFEIISLVKYTSKTLVTKVTTWINSNIWAVYHMEMHWTIYKATFPQRFQQII